MSFTITQKVPPALEGAVPAQADDSAAAKREVHSEADAPRTLTPIKNILLVEDNEMNRDMLSRRLERRGYNVACAVDGRQAIEMAASQHPALILMDMSLPVVDGWEATKQIKASEPRIPIIALTAHAMDGDETKARDAGCDDYDTKPVDLDRLLAKIESLLKKQAA